MCIISLVLMCSLVRCHDNVNETVVVSEHHCNESSPGLCNIVA